MSRHTTSLVRLAKLAVLIPLELAFRTFAALVDRAARDRTPDDDWQREPAREDWL